MNDYFVDITKTIGPKQFQFNHLSNLFKSNLDNVSDKFDFKKVHEEEVKREIMKSSKNSKKSNMLRCYTSQNS